MKKITLLLFLGFNLTLSAQGYNFTQLTGNYTNLTGSLSINNGEVWDDPEYTLTLPFAPDINGNVNANFKVYDSYLVQQTTGTIFQVVASMNNDLIDLGDGGATSLSPISYKIDGAVGSRIAKIEYQNCGGWGDTSKTMFVNFQIWIYEGSNIIEYHYGPNSVTDVNIFYGGESGPVVGVTAVDANDNLSDTYLLTGGTANPSLSGTLAYLTGTPAPNTIYRFTPTSLSNTQINATSVTSYPNPFKDFITVSGLKSAFSYAIYDVNSKLIQSGESNSSSTQIDTKSIASGIYFLKIISENESIVKKIVKM